MPEVKSALIVLTILRLFINAGGRMAYTFLPVFSRGTGLSVGDIGRLYAVRDFSAIIGPLFARLGSRIGLRSMILGSGLIASFALLIAALGTKGFIIGTIALGLARAGFHISMNGWVGEEVAYHRRARASGLVELSWGGTTLVVLPLLGIAIKYLGWQAAPGLLGFAILPLVLAAGRQRAITEATTKATKFTKPRMNRQTVATLITHGVFMGSAQCLVLTHGLWLEDTYNFDAAQIGFAVIAIGVLEVLATLFSSGFTDSIGKRNSMVGGALLMIGGMGGLLLSESPPLGQGLGLLMISFLGFEFGVVSLIPLIAELDPLQRAGVFGWSMFVAQISRGVFTLVATWLYQSSDFGFRAVMGLAIALAGGAVVLALSQIQEPSGPVTDVAK